MKLKCISYSQKSNIEYWPIIRSIESGIEHAREWYEKIGKPKNYHIKIYDDTVIYWEKKS